MYFSVLDAKLNKKSTLRIHTVKHSGGSIMLCGGKVLLAVTAEGKMDWARFVIILDESVFQSPTRWFKTEPESFIIAQLKPESESTLYTISQKANKSHTHAYVTNTFLFMLNPGPSSCEATWWVNQTAKIKMKYFCFSL